MESKGAAQISPLRMPKASRCFSLKEMKAAAHSDCISDRRISDGPCRDPSISPTYQLAAQIDTARDIRHPHAFRQTLRPTSLAHSYQVRESAVIRGLGAIRRKVQLNADGYDARIQSAESAGSLTPFSLKKKNAPVDAAQHTEACVFRFQRNCLGREVHRIAEPVRKSNTGRRAHLVALASVAQQSSM